MFSHPSAPARRSLAAALLFPLAGGALSACAPSDEAAGTPDASQPASGVTVEAPDSPQFGTESAEPIGRSTSFVELWNGERSGSGFELAEATIVPIEVLDGDGEVVGFLSTCFPLDACGPDLAEGDHVIESSSGTSHVVHVMDGVVTVAEVLAGVDLAERQPSG